jgi:uncharacterized membrane protein
LKKQGLLYELISLFCSASLAAFFEGYGFMTILVLISVSLILWFISAEGKSRLTMRLITVLTVFLLAMGTVEFIYFFPLPGILSTIAGICTLAAGFRMK